MANQFQFSEKPSFWRSDQSSENRSESKLEYSLFQKDNELFSKNALETIAKDNLKMASILGRVEISDNKSIALGTPESVALLERTRGMAVMPESPNLKQRASTGEIFRNGNIRIDADGDYNGSHGRDSSRKPQTNLGHDGSINSGRNNFKPAEESYVVAPGDLVRSGKLRYGQLALIEYNGKVVPAVVADCGPNSNNKHSDRGRNIEISIAAAKSLGLNDVRPNLGGTEGYQARQLFTEIDVQIPYGAKQIKEAYSEWSRRHGVFG